MKYNRVPQEFLKGIFLAPNNFSDPEKPQHGQYVNLQLRNDLYFSAFNSISNIQFPWISLQNQQYLKVQKFQQCKQEMPWYSNYARQYKVKKGKSLKDNEKSKVQMISCQQWLVSYNTSKNKPRLSRYRVQVKQSSTDIFQSELYPLQFWKSVKDLLIN